MNGWMRMGDEQSEKVMLDLGMMLARLDSDWDGALPAIINILQDPALKGIFISHRHLDHMGAIVKLAQLGLLAGKDIYGAERDMAVLKEHMREVNDKRLLPHLRNLNGQGVVDFKHLSVEYCVDGMKHSTKSNIYRVVARKTEQTRNLTADQIEGSYVFYGDARGVANPEFLGRGLRTFGPERQDTVIDVDCTRAKTPGESEEDGENIVQNRADFGNCWPDDGLIVAEISTNDEGIKWDYQAANLMQRNFTFIGHNLEVTGRAHNGHGVDPEYEMKYLRDNINRFLESDAERVTKLRTAHLFEKLGQTMDPFERKIIKDEISVLTLYPAEYHGRGSAKAKNWLLGNLGKFMAIVTGTQGELFSALMRHAEGWSVLDSSRPSGFKIKPRQFVYSIEQSAIPGNHEHQLRMIKKLLANRCVKAVSVAIEDGFKIYGLDAKGRAEFKKRYAKEGRHFLDTEDDTLIVSGAPIYESGHGKKKDIEKIVKIANADIAHPTHTSDQANVIALCNDICEPNGLRHTGRQYFDGEHMGIKMGATSAQAQVTSLGREHPAMILFKIIRRFGTWYGGTLRAKQVSLVNGRTSWAASGVVGDNIEGKFEKNLCAVDFVQAAKRADDAMENEFEPPEGVQIPLQERRRFRALQEPKEVKLTETRLAQIDSYVRRIMELAA